MTNIKIWGAETGRTFRPIWVAEELGLVYEHLPIQPRTGETQTEEFTSLNRKQKVPFLEDGDLRLSESIAICRYLVRKYPNQSISVPTTELELAKEDEWLSYVYGELDETALYVMRRHGDLAQIYGHSETVLQSCKDYLIRHFAVLDHHLSKHEYLMPIGFSLADIILVSCIDWADFYQIDIPQGVKTYRDRIAERPTYLKAMKINFPILLGSQS